MISYNILFIRRDGTVSLFYETAAWNDADITAIARKMERPEFETIEVWRESNLIYQATNLALIA